MQKDQINGPAEGPDFLKAIGELATEEYTYTGIYKLSNGQIPFITKKGFTMVYTANFKAGVKVKDIKVQVNQDQVTVTLPQSQLLQGTLDGRKLVIKTAE